MEPPQCEIVVDRSRAAKLTVAEAIDIAMKETLNTKREHAFHYDILFGKVFTPIVRGSKFCIERIKNLDEMADVSDVLTKREMPPTNPIPKHHQVAFHTHTDRDPVCNPSILDFVANFNPFTDDRTWMQLGCPHLGFHKTYTAASVQSRLARAQYRVVKLGELTPDLFDHLVTKELDADLMEDLTDESKPTYTPTEVKNLLGQLLTRAKIKTTLTKEHWLKETKDMFYARPNVPGERTHTQDLIALWRTEPYIIEDGKNLNPTEDPWAPMDTDTLSKARSLRPKGARRKPSE